jgi:hypothetical protein
MAELVDASDSKSDSARSAGSIPARGTRSQRNLSDLHQGLTANPALCPTVENQERDFQPSNLRPSAAPPPIAGRFMTTKPPRSKCSARRRATMAAMSSSALWTRLGPAKRRAKTSTHEVMSAFEQFLEDNPDMADKPYVAAMAGSLSLAFPCQAR